MSYELYRGPKSDDTSLLGRLSDGTEIYLDHDARIHAQVAIGRAADDWVASHLPDDVVAMPPDEQFTYRWAMGEMMRYRLFRQFADYLLSSAKVVKP